MGNPMADSDECPTPGGDRRSRSPAYSMSDDLDCLQFVYYCQQSVETVQGVLHYPGDLTTDEVKTVVGLMEKWKKGLLDEAASQKLPYRSRSRSRSRGRSRSRSRSRSRDSGNRSTGTQGSAGTWDREEAGGVMDGQVSSAKAFDSCDSDGDEPNPAAAGPPPPAFESLPQKPTPEEKLRIWRRALKDLARLLTDAIDTYGKQ